MLWASAFHQKEIKGNNQRGNERKNHVDFSGSVWCMNGKMRGCKKGDEDKKNVD